jgi:hypothetical protein
MSASERYLLGLVVVLIDWLLFAVPLTGIAAAYILIARPPSFREWVDKLYAS